MIDDIQKFYESKEWYILKRKVLSNYHNRCAKCNSKAYVVHHIKSINTHFHLRDKITNLIPLCSRCHAKEHFTIEAKYKRKLEENKVWYRDYNYECSDKGVINDIH